LFIILTHVTQIEGAFQIVSFLINPKRHLYQRKHLGYEKQKIDNA